MKVLAVDPGGVSGWATLTGKNFASGEIPGGAVPMCDAVWAQIHSLDFVICERFNINAGTHQKARDMNALNVIGFLTWATHYVEIPLVLQNPSDGKGKENAFATTDKLKKLGWHKPSKGDHQNDAARHLLKCVVTLPYYSYLAEDLLK